MRTALGILAGVILLFWVLPVAAQDQTCKLRCTTIYQIFDEEIAATIALACDDAAIRCKGEGALRLNGEMVPTSITASFVGISMNLHIQTAQGILTSGAPRDSMTATPDGTFQVILGNTSEAQSKTAALRWFILQMPGGSNRRLDPNIGGHVKVVIDKYASVPPRNP